MAKSFAPAFQLYVNDWIAGTMFLNPEQRGALIQLKVHAWRAEADGHPPCSLPNDDEKLAILSDLRGRWGKVGPSVRALFRVDGDRLVDDALLRNRDEKEAYHKDRSDAGKLGAEKRWEEERRRRASQRDSSASGLPNGSAISEPVANSSSSSSTASSTASNGGGGTGETPPPAAAVAGAGTANDNDQPLPPAALELLARVAEPKRADAESQLRATLYDPMGGRIRRGEYAKARDLAHLERACRAVLEAPPVGGPSKFALFVLYRLADLETPAPLGETSSGPRESVRSFAEDLDAARVYVAEHPQIAAEIQAEAIAQIPGNERGDMRKRDLLEDELAVERWRAAGSPIAEREANA